MAELVVAGKSTSTWRLYDDKDLSIDDDVTLIDKVNPNDRSTWRPVGTAHINELIQNRLGDITAADGNNTTDLSKPEKLLKTFQLYYGPQVTLKTPIKIVHFSFTSQANRIAHIEDKNTTNITEVKMFADGGSRGNPGPSASGFVITDMDDNIIVKQGIYLGVTTNNQAEYRALKFGLEEAAKMRVQTVHVYMDSLLVVNQMLGVFKVKNRDLWPIHDAIKQLAMKLKHVSYMQVPREFNKLADAAVNEALDAAGAPRLTPRGR